MTSGDATQVRLTGFGTLPGGRRISWTVADGTRGRRWRAATTGSDGRLVHGLLLETTPDGTPTRAEVTAAGGVLTLHPGHDGAAMHGNCAREDGVDHIDLPWGRAFVLLFDASPVTAAVAARTLATSVGVGEGVSVPAIEIREDLTVRHATWRVARVGPSRWRLLAADGGASTTVELDDDGLPALADARRWPMEVRPAG